MNGGGEIDFGFRYCPATQPRSLSPVTRCSVTVKFKLNIVAKFNGST
jgi:hypothetical protein